MAPRAATRRVLARQAFEGLARSYEGAARGRRTDGWHAPGSSADAEIGRAGALLRDRMRDLVRNNPHAAKAVSVLVNNIIGAGIMPRAASGDAALDREVDRLFETWARGCDADGQLDFYGLQTLACREMVEAGEVLVRRRPRRALVAAEIVHHDHVARIEGGRQNSLDIGAEDIGIDGTVEHPRGLNPVMAQGGDEGRCVPVAKGRGSGEARPFWGPAPQRGHVRLHPCLVNEDQP